MAGIVSANKDFNEANLKLFSFENEEVEKGLNLENVEEITDENKRRQIIDDIRDRMKGDMVYGINESPPMYYAVFLGLQHFMTMFTSCMYIPLVLSGPLCIVNAVDVTNLIGTNFFICGLLTLLQTTFGVRLPIVQGTSSGFLVPALALLRVDGPCPEPPPQNATAEEVEYASGVWHGRMRQLQGAIMIASTFQIIMGFTGIIGILLRFIGPVTIAATIGTVGLTLFPVAAARASSHWGISIFTICLIILFSQILTNVPISCCGKRKIYVFHLFSIMLSIIIPWILCGILTVSNVLPGDPSEYGYRARTDINTDVLFSAPWFRLPWPGQWGVPTLVPAAIVGMFAAVMASIIDSVGDYYACAGICGAPPPPAHAVNRGIAIEGLGCFFAGLWGTGTGNTSYITNIAEIGLTKVASLLVIQICGVMLMMVGLFGKVNAIFATIPDPVIGGMLAATFGMLTMAGFSTLQFVDLKSSRNLVIVGVAVFFGMTVPDYVDSIDGFNTGSESFNQFLEIILSTGMLLAGIIACFLDNIVPGTKDQRGFIKWQNDSSFGDEDEDKGEKLMKRYPELFDCYDLPFGMKYIRNWSWIRYLPISPTFRGFRLSGFKAKRLPEKL